VVSAAPSARASSGVTGTRTGSLPLAVSVSGKRDFGAREKCAEKPPTRNRVFSQERTVARIPANPRSFVPLQEISGSTRVRGGGRSCHRTRLCPPKFPSGAKNREIH
jgi:hypothetical protein